MNVKAIITSHIITQPRQSEWHGEAPAWRFAHVDQGQVPTSRSRAPTGTSQTLHKTFHRKKGPKVGGKSMPKVDVSSAIPSCGRA
jgi:hypothetical protein